MDETLDKQKVIAALRQLSAEHFLEGEKYYLYDLGRKNSANYLLAEIYLGHLD